MKFMTGAEAIASLMKPSRGASREEQSSPILINTKQPELAEHDLINQQYQMESVGFVEE